jgi:hypothetical protein
MKVRAPYEWGAIRPSFPPAAADAELAGPGVAPSAAAPAGEQPAVAPRSQATVDTPGASLPWGVVVLAGALTIGFAVWLGRRHARANR